MLGAASVAADDNSFQDVLLNAKAYHGQRVSLVGTVVGNGPLFQLYKSGSDSQRPAPPSQSIQLVWEKGWRKGLYDLHKVRIIGVVDANRHGPWGNPCTISLENMSMLSPNTTTLSRFPSAVFRNERSDSVTVKSHGGNPEVEFPLAPAASMLTFVANGETIVVFSRGGKVLARSKIGDLRGNSPYYDMKTGNFFYRIVDNRIERVFPDAARTWKWLP